MPFFCRPHQPSLPLGQLGKRSKLRGHKRWSWILVVWGVSRGSAARFTPLEPSTLYILVPPIWIRLKPSKGLLFEKELLLICIPAHPRSQIGSQWAKIGLEIFGLLLRCWITQSILKIRFTANTKKSGVASSASRCDEPAYLGPNLPLRLTGSTELQTVSDDKEQLGLSPLVLQ